MKNPRVIYFCDPGGDEAVECRDLQKYLKSVIGLDVPVELWERPPFDERFDILFFDWGGMSMGNSLMEHFCREILKLAEDNPGRVFIMTSTMTAAAMVDALEELKDRPNNIYLGLEKAKTALMCFTE
jgi:hypothetical protein